MPKGKQAGVNVDILLFLLLLGGGENFSCGKAVGWNDAGQVRAGRREQCWTGLGRSAALNWLLMALQLPHSSPRSPSSNSANICSS